MESRSIDLKILFARDLKAFNFFQKLSVYAVVTLVTDDPKRRVEKPQQHRTPTDKENDGNPEWNHEMQFDIGDKSVEDIDHLFIQFQLHAEAMFGDKSIGEVRVPINDITVGSQNGITRFVNYEVRSGDGKSNGILSFSYKVNKAASSGIGCNNLIEHSSNNNNDNNRIEYPSLEPWQGHSGMEYHNHNNSPAAAVHTSHEVHYPPTADPYLPPSTHFLPPPPPLLPPPHFFHHPPPPPPQMWDEMFHRPYPPHLPPWVARGSYESSPRGTHSPRGWA